MSIARTLTLTAATFLASTIANFADLLGDRAKALRREADYCEDTAGKVRGLATALTAARDDAPPPPPDYDAPPDNPDAPPDPNDRPRVTYTNPPAPAGATGPTGPEAPNPEGPPPPAPPEEDDPIL